ncbi:hypothetical protein [Modestobacter sp. DSM 44400]|uniref:hypothetical protein n=1 Tax=Modestobacter sp. DSM 44400 TaxID=1550230 RepID=UPI0011151D45|nr:hypothetical protein [Modestobacter sp. DSM 44400]
MSNVRGGNDEGHRRVGQRSQDSFAEVIPEPLEPTRRVCAAQERERRRVAALHDHVRRDAHLRVDAARTSVVASMNRSASPLSADLVKQLNAPFYRAAVDALAPAVESMNRAVSRAAVDALAPAVESMNRAWLPLYAEILKKVTGPVIEAANDTLAGQVDDLVQRLYSQVLTCAMPAIEEAAGALADSDLTIVDAEDDTGVADWYDAGEFASTLDAFIAVGLTGRDLVVNTWAVAQLATVRQVQQLWGRKAARMTLAVFISAAVTVAVAAWLVDNGDKSVSEAFTTAAVGTFGILAVLLAVWNSIGGE